MDVESQTMRPQEIARGNRLSQDEEARRIQAYRDCESDAKAARSVGVAQPTFQRWRAQRGLPPKNPWPEGRTGRGEVDEEARFRAYEHTFSDEAAARLLAINASTFRTWRRRMGLPAIGARIGGPLAAQA
jgi:transposase-like protein